MKRSRKKDEDVSWEDPNKLKIADLEKVLLVFGIKFDKTERRTQLFQRYVQLARIESPESVELWTGQDSLEAALPAADQLVVPTLKIFLALHKVEYPAQASRGHLIKLYNSIPNNTRPRRRGSDVSVVIPVHRESKKRKTTSTTTSNSIPPVPALNSYESPTNDARATTTSSNVGKSLPKRGRQAVFLPYSKPPFPPIAARTNRQISRQSRKRPSSQTSPSTQGERSHEPLQSLRQAREVESASLPSNRRSKSRTSKSNNDRYPDISLHVDDREDLCPSTNIQSGASCTSSIREAPSQRKVTTSQSTPSSRQTRSPTFQSQSSARESLLPESQDDELASETASRVSSVKEAPFHQTVTASTSASKWARSPKYQSQSSVVESLLSEPQEDELASESTSHISSFKKAPLPPTVRESWSISSSKPLRTRNLSFSQSSAGQSLLADSQVDELASSTTEVPSLSEASISTRHSEKARDESVCENIGESQIASSLDGRCTVPQTSRSSDGSPCPLVEAQEDELVPSTRTRNFSQSSAGQSSLAESQVDELASSTTEVPSLSEASLSTRHSEKARDESDCDNNGESQIASSSVGRRTISQTSRLSDVSTRSLAGAQEDELGSSAIEMGSMSGRSVQDVSHTNKSESHIDHYESCFPTSQSSEGPLLSRRSARLKADQNSRSTNARSTSLISGSSKHSADLQDTLDSSESESTISNGRVRKTGTEPSIENSSSRATSLAVESTSSASSSNSTIVPNRQAKESEQQSKTSSVSDQSEQHAPTAAESSDVNAQCEEESTQETCHQLSRDSNSPRTHHDVSDPTPEGRNRKVLKRKAQHPSKWPDASQLSRAEIEAYLDEHNVLYNRGARVARLVGSYNLLRTNLSQRETAEPVGKRRRIPRSSVGSSARDSPPLDPVAKRFKSPRSSLGSRARYSANLSRRSRRQNRRKVVASSDTDEAGFVYLRPESPRCPPVSPGPSSQSSTSNYEPSVAPTVEVEPSVDDVSEPSISTRSTRKHRRDSPPTNSSKKQSKKNGKAQAQAPRKRGRPRKPTVQRKFRLRRAPASHNSQPNVNSEANFCPQAHPTRDTPPARMDVESNCSYPIPQAPRNSKKHRLTDFSPSPDRANRTCPVPHVDESPQPIHCRPLRQPPRNNKRSKRLERTRANSYTAHPSFHQNDILLPPPIDHFNQLPEPRSHNLSVPPVIRQEADDHSNTTRRPQPCTSDIPPPGITSRKRKQPEDTSPIAHSKRQTIPVGNPCISSVHRPSLRSSVRPASLRSSVRPGSLRSAVERPRRRHERVKEKSYVARPSMHDDPIPETQPNVNRVSNIEAWRSSVPPNSGCPSPPAHQHTDRTHDQLNSKTCGCNSKEALAHLRRIADTVEGLAIQGGCNSNRTQRQAVGSRPSGGYRDLSLLARVRLHIRALLGKCMELNQFPPPATQREKAQWKRVLEDESDDEDMSDDIHPTLEEDQDPAFPYPNGPGHRSLSASALAIMWRSMRRAGVVSFRPDFSRGPREVDNMFLWNLACSIFIKLVNAGEYEEIDLETSSEASIRQAILNHAKQLQRQYREAGWNPDRLDERAVKKRRQERTRRLRDHRIKYISNKPGLAALIPVVTECTSDAETIDEDQDSDADMDHGEQPLKRVLVQSIPWRHPRLTRAFDMIDKLIDLRRESGCKEYGKPAHIRLRPREDAVIVSDRPCANTLPADCYNPEWLGSQTIPLINSLKIQPSPDLTPMIRKLEDLVRSR